MQNHDPLFDEIHHALDAIQPTEEAKDRIYRRVFEHQAIAESERPAKKPWYLRWQTSAIGTAALACVVVLTVLIHGYLPSDETAQLEVVPQQTTISAESNLSAETTTTAATAEFAAVQVTSVTSEITTSDKSDNETTSTDETAQAEAQTTCTETQAQTQGQTQTAPAQTTAPPRQTTAARHSTTAIQQTTTQATTTAHTTQTTAPAIVTTQAKTTTTQTVTTTTAESETTETTVSGLPIRQSIFAYNRLSWNGVLYETAYDTVNSRDIDTYLGAAVTEGESVSDTYTVLVYTIQGESEGETLAVQYAGMNAYYIFTIVT